jgi:hypothetical protein
LYFPAPRDNISICSGKQCVIGKEEGKISVTYTESSQFSVFFAACTLDFYVVQDCQRDKVCHGSQDAYT